LDERITLGVDLQTRAIPTEKELREAREDVRRWIDFNEELLSTLAEDDALVADYRSASRGGSRILSTYSSLPEKIDHYRKGLAPRINALRSIHERLPLFAEPPGRDPDAVDVMARPMGHLHPVIADAAAPLFDGGHYSEAVFRAAKALNQMVRELTGLREDGEQLMGHAFSEKEQLLPLADLTTTTGADVQRGFRFMAQGAMIGLRNPEGHELDTVAGPDEAIEMLGLFSLIARRLDRRVR
jgi:uncharacterized protein (TIGR02391 family)